MALVKYVVALGLTLFLVGCGVRPSEDAGLGESSTSSTAVSLNQPDSELDAELEPDSGAGMEVMRGLGGV